MRKHGGIPAAALSLGILLTACGKAQTSASSTQPPSNPATSRPPVTNSSSPTQKPVPSEKPVPTESSPPGDIPDSIAFVPYTSKDGGFKITTPEGWARTAKKGSVIFTDKLNTVELTWGPASAAPTVKTATADEVPVLQSSVRAFTLGSVKNAPLPAGPAVLISYQANSEPNAVTAKQYRQDVLRYELFHNGTQVNLTLLSPVGADNVAPWRIVTESLAWV